MVSKDTEDFLLKLGVVGGVLGLGGYAVYRLVSAATTPGCTTPGTACYSAIQPTLQGLQGCQNEYSSLLSTYTSEDNANGTALTPQQKANLNYIMDSCVQPYIVVLSRQLQPYNFQNTIVEVAEFVVVGALVYALVRVSPTVIRGIVNSLRTQPRTAPEMASQTVNATVRALAPELSPSTLTSWQGEVVSYSSDLVSYDAAAYQQYVELGVLDAAEADSLLSEAGDAMLADAEDTATLLAELS